TRTTPGAAGWGRTAPRATPLPELDARAKEALVATDDAVRTSEEELGFATAQFGEEAAAPFAEAVGYAKNQLTDAFRLRQQLDDAFPEDDTARRRMLDEILSRCANANDRLDAVAEDFDRLRELERDAPQALAAAETLRTAGVRLVARVTEHPPHPLRAVRPADGAPLLTRTTVTALTGRPRLTGVRVRHEDGRTTTLACDTVVFTADWIPEHELARRGGLPLDPGTRGPAHDPAYRTAEPGVFAVGNLLHGGESAATAAREGRAVTGPVLSHLAAGTWPAGGPRLTVAAPLEWIAPNLTGPAGTRPDALLLRTGRRLTAPLIVAGQDGEPLYRRRLARTVPPGRSFPLAAHWLEHVDPQGGPVHIRLA
ncbi:NAD(P)/FAD-dependent oxidoreductase, partial [Streptomyces sp. OfavH-34-F]|uniref:FAD-dependent oxidoreductase n=1 Tax=Streptomyces sp. OfavH-34-F TaxID=2917760 RepID=UPI001EF27BD5